MRHITRYPTNSETHHSLLLLKRHDVISAHMPHFSDPVTVTACRNVSLTSNGHFLLSVKRLASLHQLWIGVPLVRLNRGSSLDKNARRQSSDVNRTLTE